MMRRHVAGGFMKGAAEGSLHADKYGRVDEWVEGPNDAMQVRGGALLRW